LSIQEEGIKGRLTSKGWKERRTPVYKKKESPVITSCTWGKKERREFGVERGNRNKLRKGG